MSDKWTLRGAEFGNCNCNWGCPCQFNAPASHGFCEGFAAGHIESGHFNDIPGLVESTGSPSLDPNNGGEFRARIDLPNGFEYDVVEMGNGSTMVTAGISLELSDSYAQFNLQHMSQDGVIR